MLSLLLAGGPFMFATLAVSLITLGIFMWRVVFLWGKSASRKALLSQVIGYTEARDYAKAIQLCSSSESPLAKILTAALVRANRSEREIRRSVDARSALIPLRWVSASIRTISTSGSTRRSQSTTASAPQRRWSNVTVSRIT